MGTAKDPDSHVFNCSRGGLKPQPISNRHDPPMLVLYCCVQQEAARRAVNTTFAKDRSESSLCATERGVYLFDGVGEVTSRRSYLSSSTATARIQPPVPPT